MSNATSPYYFRARADGTGTGNHRFSDGWMRFAGGGYVAEGNSGPMTLDCGASPVSGTIGDNIRFACQR